MLEREIVNNGYFPGYQTYSPGILESSMMQG